MRGKARFVLGYAARDMFRGPSSGTTAVVCFSLAVLATAVVALFGWVLGADHVRRDRIKNDPMSMCLWVSAADAAERIRPETLAQLQAELAARPKPVVVVPLDQCEFGCAVAPDGGPVRTRPRRGLTLAPNDPLTTSLKVTNGRWFEGPNEVGAVVTRDFLTGLGYNPDAGLPVPVGFRHPVSHAVIPIPVIGVTADPLPLKHSFALTAGFEKYLQENNPDVKTAEVRTGPVSNPALLDPRNLPAAAGRAVEEVGKRRGVEFEKGQHEGKPVWVGRSQSDKEFFVREWAVTISTLRDDLVKAKEDPGETFAKVAPLNPPAEGTVQVREGTEWAAVYANEPAELRDVVAVVKRYGLAVNEDVVAKIEALDRATRDSLRLLRAATVLFGLLTLGTLAALIEIRSAHKVPEIALLKVMGLGRRGLAAIYLTEAAVMWAISLAAGALFGWVAGRLGAGFLAPDLRDRTSDAFVFPTTDVLGLVFLSGPLVMLAVSVATLRARQASPMLTLGRGG
jgi:hypothetical protein